MSDQRWFEVEAGALATTFRSTPPDQPTLCPGWDTVRLLAHLIQRGTGLRGPIGDLIARRPPGEEPNLTKLVDSARTPNGYEALIRRFERGAPAWSPMSWAGETLNFTEYVIHHEDVRRGGDAPLPPRDLPVAEQDAIWRKLSGWSKFAYRRAPVGVRLTRTDGDSVAARRAASVGVEIVGDPVELLLYVSGRRRAAQVQISGPEAAVSWFESWLA